MTASGALCSPRQTVAGLHHAAGRAPDLPAALFYVYISRQNRSSYQQHCVEHIVRNIHSYAAIHRVQHIIRDSALRYETNVITPENVRFHTGYVRERTYKRYHL